MAIGLPGWYSGWNHLSMQGDRWNQSQEDPMPQSNWTHMPQLLKLVPWVRLRNRRSHCSESRGPQLEVDPGLCSWKGPDNDKQLSQSHQLFKKNFFTTKALQMEEFISGPYNPFSLLVSWGRHGFPFLDNDRLNVFSTNFTLLSTFSFFLWCDKDHIPSLDTHPHT